MATHNKITHIIRASVGCIIPQFLVIDSKGNTYACGENGVGQLGVVVIDSIRYIRNTKSFGPVVSLDSVPPKVAEYVKSLPNVGRFPKCFGWLTKIPKGGLKAVQMSNRDKQELNELIAHGLVKKTNAGNYINI